MKLIVQLTLILGLLHSCSNIEDPISECAGCSFTCLVDNEPDAITNDCLDNWECNFVIKPQSKVSLTEREGITAGSNLGFQMIASTEGDLVIADDEFTDILVFEIDDGLTSFHLEDSEMKEINLYFRKICYCSDKDFKEISKGCIQGEEQSDGSWFIQGNLIISYEHGDIDLKVDAQFTF